jgi:hypothetical protein
MTDDGTVEIHGKTYNTVAKRIKQFRDDHPHWTVGTKILSNADVILIRATIRDEGGRMVATGTAEEERGRTQILSTSALETCETSAVGRALAFLGYAGTEIASDEEIEQAKAQQAELVNETIVKLKTHNAAVRENIESIVAIKHYLLNDDYSSAYEAYSELDDDTKTAITLAPTKGGIFTTLEVKKIRSNEWSEARRAYHGLEAIDD